MGGKKTKCNKRRERDRNIAEKRVRVKLNCRLREPLSSRVPSLFYLSHVEPRLPPFTCQCIYNSELSAPGCVGGETSSSLLTRRGLNPNGPDGTGWYRTAQNRCVDLGLSERAFVKHDIVCVCVSLWTDRFPSTGLASRVEYLDGAVL